MSYTMSMTGKRKAAECGDNCMDSINELFARALSYDHVFSEIAKTSGTLPRGVAIEKLRQDLCGFTWESLHLPKKDLPLVVTLSTAEQKIPPLYLDVPHIEIVWKECPPRRQAQVSPAVPEIGILKTEEELLAKHLRKCCDAFGKERDEQLKESGSVMLDMSQIYLERAQANHELAQVISFVKDSGKALEIKSRYENIQRNDEAVHECCNSVARELAEAANAVWPENVPISSGLSFGLMNVLMTVPEPFDRNCDDKLSESKNLFRDIDSYLSQAVVNCSMEVKLCFIKAAGLAIAAKIRFEKVENKEGRDNAVASYRGIFRELLKVAAAASGSETANILGLLTSLEVRLMAYREKEGDELKDIVVIKEQDFGEALHEKEIQKAEQVRNLCLRNTTNFITIMSKISEKCQEILGKPPCKFVIVGLGSLARREVTLYSDFEHAIALENAAEEGPEWSSIQEYFRWFTVLFHTIVVGLGETVIPSLDIQSLYEGNSSKCWFSDEITPNGISFDGMMPHACKIPLGRTGKTTFKEHTVELIQTAKNLAQFLTRDEDVKNGYFLKEVMSRTCLVSGDKEVYDSYLEEGRNILIREGSEDIATRVAKYILLNPLDTVRGTHVDFFAQQKSIKVTTYRPMTTLLAYIGRLCGINNNQSSFEILDKMRSSGVLCDDSYHVLTYALAVAIEGGLKGYHFTGHQRKMLIAASWASLVSKRSWIDCQVVLELLRSIAKQLPPTRCLKIKLPLRTSDHWKIHACVHLPTLVSFIEGAKVTLELVCSTVDKFINSEIAAHHADSRLKVLLGNLRHCFLRMHLRRLEGNSASETLPFRQDLSENQCQDLLRCEWACEKMLQMLPVPEVDVAAYQSLCVIRFSQKRYREGLAFFEQWHEVFKGSSHEQNFLDMWMYEMIMRMEVMGYENVLVYIAEKLLENIPFERRCILEMTRCQVWLKTERKNEARKGLLRATLHIRANVDKLNKYAYEYLLRRIREIQKESKLLQQVAITTRLLSDVVAENFTQDMKLVLEQRRAKDRELGNFHKKKVDPQTMMRELEQKVGGQSMRGPLLAMLRSQELSVCFTYKEMMDLINVTVAQCKSQVAARGYFLAYVFSLMALFENVRIRDVAHAVKLYHEAPSKVKAYRALQPFLYAFLKDTSSIPGTVSARDHQEQILNGIFGREGNGKLWEIYRLALSCFVNLQLEDCVAILWKIFYFGTKNSNVKRAAVELFVTAAVAFLVLQKRKNPAKYFSKTREISRKQLQWVTAAVTMGTDAFAERNLFRSKLYIYADVPLVPVYNFAVECNDTNLKKFCVLHWKILNDPCDSPRVKRASLLSLSDAVCFTYSSRHNALQTHAL